MILILVRDASPRKGNFDPQRGNFGGQKRKKPLEVVIAGQQQKQQKQQQQQQQQRQQHPQQRQQEQQQHQLQQQEQLIKTRSKDFWLSVFPTLIESHLPWNH